MSSQQSSGIKSLLLKAWRERWDDMRWSINVKKLLPIAGNGDSCQLSELLLKQALIGSSPNILVLSYLKHAIATQMVTYRAVIQSLVKNVDIEKPYCVNGLLDVVENFSQKLSKKGVSEDSLGVSKALLMLVKWLLKLVGKCLQKLSDNKQSTEHCLLISKATDLVRKFVEDKPSKALLYIAKLEEPETFQDLEQTSSNIESNLNPSQINADLKLKLDTCLNMIRQIDVEKQAIRPLLNVSFNQLNLSINVLVSLEAILHPANKLDPFLQQIILIEQMQGLSRPVVYSELIRACWMGLVDSAAGTDELKWAALTFLKMPEVLSKLAEKDLTTETTSALEQGIQKFLSYIQLLDMADSKCNCECLHYLLAEIMKRGLLTDLQCKRLITRRQAEAQKQKTGEQQQGTQPSASLILRAEFTVTSLLKTLDADYSKTQEAMLGVLCQMVSGKSFELILSAAAATGKLQTFAVKLVKCNEYAKQTAGEAGKGAQIRALLFDISFLMLCHITQLYGTELLAYHPESSSSFFVRWALQCLPEESRHKSLELLPPPDRNKIEILINQFNPHGELKMSLTRWNDVCDTAPYAIQEMLFAWQYGALSEENICTILDKVKHKICSLPVVISAWMCSYISSIDGDLRPKPTAMLSRLLEQTDPPPNLSKEGMYYTERSHLMQIILAELTQDILPQNNKKKGRCLIPSTRPAHTLLVETYKDIFKKGCISIENIYKLEQLLKLCGPNWFCHYLIQEMLSNAELEEISKAASLLYSLFHMDLHHLTISLVEDSIPTVLQMPLSLMNHLMDPRGQYLAKLCVMCLMANQRTKPKECEHLKKGRKRTRADFETEDGEGSEEPPSKIRKSASDSDELSLQSDTFNFEALLPSQEESDTSSPAYDINDPLNQALVNLFRLFNAILNQNEMNQRTNFVICFMREVLRLGGADARFILSLLPASLISQLMKVAPREMTTDMLLMVYDLSTSGGRRIATKVISQNAKLISVPNL